MQVIRNKDETSKYLHSKKSWVCEMSWIFCGNTMPASRMSLRARLTSRISVATTDRRPSVFLSLDIFQMHAITDMLPATDVSTKMDSNAIYNSSVTDMDDISQLLIRLLTLLTSMLWYRTSVADCHDASDEHFSRNKAVDHSSQSILVQAHTFVF